MIVESCWTLALRCAISKNASLPASIICQRSKLSRRLSDFRLYLRLSAFIRGSPSCFPISRSPDFPIPNRCHTSAITGKTRRSPARLQNSHS